MKPTSEVINLSRQELEILLFEQSVRNQARQVTRMYQRADGERETLTQMEKQLQALRDAWLGRGI